jgi:hypothetical protein
MGGRNVMSACVPENNGLEKKRVRNGDRVEGDEKRTKAGKNGVKKREGQNEAKEGLRQ